MSHLKVHYCVQNSQPLVCILNQISAVPAPHTVYRTSVLILFFLLGQSLPRGLFPSDFPTDTLYAPLVNPYVLHLSTIKFFYI